jgi:hypothetical protein
MFIYVSGPYSPKNATGPADEQEQIAANVGRANAIGIELAERGHIPFIPHTNCHGWEDVHGVSREVTMRVCGEWVRRCDALYFIAPSKGANWEREIAESLGRPVYERLEDVPRPNLEEWCENGTCI